MENSGLNLLDIEKIRKVFLKYPSVDKVLLYGSRAKGNFKSSSDIDLTLVGKGVDLNLLQSIELELDDLLLPYKFDVSIYHRITNQEFLDHINRVGLEFFSRT